MGEAGILCRTSALRVGHIVSHTEQLQRLEKQVPGLTEQRYKPVQHTRDIVVQEGMQRVKCLRRYQLAILAEGVNAVDPKRGAGPSDVVIKGPEVERTSQRLADSPPDIVFEKRHQLGLVGPRLVEELGVWPCIVFCETFESSRNDGDGHQPACNWGKPHP